MQDFSKAATVKAYQNSAFVSSTTAAERQIMAQLCCFYKDCSKALLPGMTKIRDLEPDSYTDVAGKVSNQEVAVLVQTVPPWCSWCYIAQSYPHFRHRQWQSSQSHASE